MALRRAVKMYSSHTRRKVLDHLRLAERNSTKIGHMLGSNCNLKTHVQHWGIPSPYKPGAQKPPFLGRLRSLTASLTVYIFGMKHDIDNRSSALKLQAVFYIAPKRHELWSTKGFKLDRHFTHPP